MLSLVIIINCIISRRNVVFSKGSLLPGGRYCRNSQRHLKLAVTFGEEGATFGGPLLLGSTGISLFHYLLAFQIRDKWRKDAGQVFNEFVQQAAFMFKISRNFINPIHNGGCSNFSFMVM